MKKVLLTLFGSFFLIQLTYGQTDRKFSIYLQGHFNRTTHDITLGNNPSGLGLGTQIFYAQNTKLRFTGEVTGALYLSGDKVLRTYGYGSHYDGRPIPTVGNMINTFVGASYHPINAISLSFTSGPSFFNGNTVRFSVKPAINFHFPKTNRWIASVSYISIYNRDQVENHDFRFLSYSIGVRLY